VNWHSIDGNFDFADKKIVFQGQPTKYTDAQGRKQKGLAVGLAINSERFSGGEISANIRFSHVGLLNACDLVFYFDPANRWWVSAGLGSGNNAYYIRHYDGKLRVHGAAGSKNDLRAGHDYAIRVRVRGSKVTLTVDDVVVLSSIIPFPLPPSQTGVHCFDDHRDPTWTRVCCDAIQQSIQRDLRRSTSWRLSRVQIGGSPGK